MGRKYTETGVTRRVSLAIRESGFDVHDVASAADITDHELVDRLEGRVDITLDELVRVGGFLRTPVSDFFKEAA